MTATETILRDLPDPEAAERFIGQLAEKHPAQARRLEKDRSLFSDVVTVASHSPLLASTLLQNPEYIPWLSRKRAETVVRNKEELLESLARYSLTNSQLEPGVLLSRFRRRELLRIYLRDIRRLGTIAEITEEISNLADAILEHALRLAAQELDNRYGQPMETDEKGRSKRAEACIVSLGKLGSRELNYASDIDLLFLYSAEGSTAETGQRGAITNREYFIKLAETVIKLIGQPSGEGAAYRVDMRLRPHGRVGPLAASVADTIRYYRTEAAAWERQVLIRSRSSAGSEHLFQQFFKEVEPSVFSTDISVGDALRGVSGSKQKIDIENITSKRLNVKLGIGGIREIEFIAQALQLAYGGKDRWLRSPHTLITLSRLGDRGHLIESELTELADAYAFLRQAEHILQMENGLQTHSVPNDPEKRELLARRMHLSGRDELEQALQTHTGNVNRIFRRVFDNAGESGNEASDLSSPSVYEDVNAPSFDPESGVYTSENNENNFAHLAQNFPRIAAMLAGNADIANGLSTDRPEFLDTDYRQILNDAIADASDLRSELSALRRAGRRCLLEILVRDAEEKLTLRESKTRQTRLAEAAMEAAITISKRELDRRYGPVSETFDLAIMGLGKLGGGGVDYDSDLDLVIVYESRSSKQPDGAPQPAELAQRAVEIFVNALSAVTREGSLYRVDLRLRPHGKDGPLTVSHEAFADYMQNSSAIWELLAFVKLRSVGGNPELAKHVEKEIREIIHQKAAQIDAKELAAETRRIRMGLQEQRADIRRSRDIDIKYGAGGMLDIYFATRFLQLKANLPDSDNDRSTSASLKLLKDSGSLTDSQYETLAEGYDFLSALDHQQRLTVGRATRLPVANKQAMETISHRMGSTSVDEFLGTLAVLMTDIRAVFDEITGR
ncbi:MAG: hypothetical protein KF855_14335 [Acidobacteria bacterium]|nr:hypothetical protein [Acidobacteriota bacterium]